MIEFLRKPMPMNNYLMRTLLFASLFWQAPILIAQGQNTYSSRDAFYDSLEARARALSARLADISGTEPIPFNRPAPTILSTVKPSAPVQAQNAFDSLPGPPNPAPSATPADPDNQTLYRADGTPVILSKEKPSPPPKEVDSSEFMEDARGRYFVQPFVGLAMMGSEVSFSKVDYGTPTFVGEVEANVGSSVGISYGRRWKNLDAEVHFSYSHVGFDSVSTSIVGGSPWVETRPVDGSMELYQAGARVGYGVPFGESGWIRAAGGFGYGKRKDYISVTGSPNDFFDNNSVFSYDLLLSMGYEMAMGLDGFIAYRLLGASDNGNYGNIALHLFEVGLGANF